MLDDGGFIAGLEIRLLGRVVGGVRGRNPVWGASAGSAGAFLHEHGFGQVDATNNQHPEHERNKQSTVGRHPNPDTVRKFHRQQLWAKGEGL